MCVPTRWQSNKLEKKQIPFGADCTIQLKIWCIWYFTKIRHSNKAVQQAVPIIAPHINDRAWIKIIKNNIAL